MLPLRYDFLSFGGSWAQRQVFSITMIQAAIKANNLSLALALVTELKVNDIVYPNYCLNTNIISLFPTGSEAQKQETTAAV